MNSSKLKARLIIVSLLAAFIAVMLTSMTASATGSNADPAALTPADSANPDSEAIEPESDNACWPTGTACSIFNDQCCFNCQPLVGTAGRCS